VTVLVVLAATFLTSYLESAEAFLLEASAEAFLAYYFLNSDKNLEYSSTDFLEVSHLYFF